jgi:hypothetical protein
MTGRRNLWTIFLATVAVALLGACNEADLNPGNGDGDGGDGSDTCPTEKQKCYGDPDKGSVICTCDDLWDCSKNPNKCEGTAPTPGGSNSWNCSWSEFNYTCTSKGGDQSNPPGGSDWYCTWKEWGWSCTKVKTPTPPGGGTWTCAVDSTTGKITCEKDTTVPPTGSETWTCNSDKTICTQTDSEGLPPGGSGWKCNETTVSGTVTWICYGTTTSSSTPPGGNGWSCTKVDEFGTYKCTKAAESPSGSGYYSCVKGSEYSGTKCYKVAKPPAPGTVGSACSTGEKMWCDGLQYCGWGQVSCDTTTGTWKTTTVNGKKVLDCVELSSGIRPNTTCACYHYFFNPACCERPDCIVPSGSSGQVCKASAGQLCDYCNPLNSGECKGSNAVCIVTNSHETFCGQYCDPTSASACPSGYKCMTVKQKVGSTNQCIPSDYSCFY